MSLTIKQHVANHSCHKTITKSTNRTNGAKIVFLRYETHYLSFCWQSCLSICIWTSLQEWQFPSQLIEAKNLLPSSLLLALSCSEMLLSVHLIWEDAKEAVFAHVALNIPMHCKAKYISPLMKTKNHIRDITATKHDAKQIPNDC